jgi:hypothetical protein
MPSWRGAQRQLYLYRCIVEDFISLIGENGVPSPGKERVGLSVCLSLSRRSRFSSEYIKDVWGSGGIVPRILNLGTGWR